MRTIMLVASVLAFTACGDDDSTGSSEPSTPTTTPARTELERVTKDCYIPIRALGDDGRSVTFDTEGTDDTEGDTIDRVVCVLVGIGAPDSFFERIDHTRALDGTQTTGWEGYTATWNYHPDSGLFIVIEEA